jgi:ankyrin repeat protein
VDNDFESVVEYTLKTSPEYAQQPDARTALQSAIKKGCKNIVDILLKYGTKP